MLNLAHFTFILAVEVRGHETPVVIGLPHNITCSTHLKVTRIEWVVTAVGNAVETEEGGAQSVVLPLNPTTTGLNGAEFTCRITTAQGKTFSEIISVEVKGELMRIRP